MKGPVKRIVIALLVLAAAIAIIRLLPYIPGFLGEHDLPEVVDNGPIAIYRGGATPTPEGGDYRRWEIHHNAPLIQLRAWAWDEMNNVHELAKPVPLSGVDDIVFDLVSTSGGTTTATMTLSRDPWWKLTFPQKVRVRSDVEFDLTGGKQPLSPRTRTGLALRLSAVRVNPAFGDATVVCLRESPAPESHGSGYACQNNERYLTRHVQVQLCANVVDYCHEPFQPNSAN